MKRIIVSKGDGVNYYWHSPDGKIYDMKKSLGGFYKVKFNEHHWAIPKWEALKKDQFILEE